MLSPLPLAGEDDSKLGGFERGEGKAPRLASQPTTRNHWAMREEAKRDLARKLRAEMTPHERKLWYLLRDRRFEAVKFRRQLPIGPYVADFAAVTSKLVIELDGGQHAESKSDHRRDAYLREEGWTVLRFWNNELIDNRDGVLTKIAEVLKLQ